MNYSTFKAFVKTALAIQCGQDTPVDYLKVKAAMLTKYPQLKLANMEGVAPPQQAPQSKFHKFREGARGEVGPAAGAVLGAGIANMYNVNPLAGAAAGYGIGAIPEVIHSIRHRV